MAIIDYLLAQGADADLRSPKGGDSPIHHAAYFPRAAALHPLEAQATLERVAGGAANGIAHFAVIGYQRFGAMDFEDRRFTIDTIAELAPSSINEKCAADMTALTRAPKTKRGIGDRISKRLRHRGAYSSYRYQNRDASGLKATVRSGAKKGAQFWWLARSPKYQQDGSQAGFPAFMISARASS